MNNVFWSQYRQGSAPGREQNLFVSLSRHLYMLKDGSLKYQQKELDPRTAGSRTLLTRYVLLDVDSGTLYGELHAESDEKDLAGFLARAWHIKADHPMRGLPGQLNLPSGAMKDDVLRSDVYQLAQWGSFRIGELPSGFAAGVHAVKQFEKAVLALFWRTSRGSVPSLFLAQALSAHLSNEASNSMSHVWREKWLERAGPSDDFLSQIDGLYREPGLWRTAEPFALALSGIPNRQTSG